MPLKTQTQSCVICQIMDMFNNMATLKRSELHNTEYLFMNMQVALNMRTHFGLKKGRFTFHCERPPSVLARLTFIFIISV